MKKIQQHSKLYCDVVQKNLQDMLDIATQSTSDAETLNCVKTEKPIVISIHYTGTVFGEYLLAMDEATAAKLIGIDELIDDSNREEIYDEICDALKEVLNVIVGDAIVDLQETFAKLTFTAPRIFFGQIRYPNFRTVRSTLVTDAGEIECHFCLDMMRLNLAESYDTAMRSLLSINEKLKESNQQLAEHQAQLVHSEKMASIGVLAAGVAHEINTPLFAVDVNLETFDNYFTIMETTIGLYENFVNSLGSSSENFELPDSDTDDLEFVIDDTKSLLTESRQSTTKIMGIINNLKNISNLDKGELVPTDINQLANDVLTMLGEKIKDTEIENDFTELPTVKCNAGEIAQVIINLIMNAVDASEGNQKITLSTRIENDEILFSVDDNGHGISDENLNRIFEPFFTTKDVGSGVGLGLSVSHGIIQKHNGRIQIESKEGHGTQATIRIPVDDKQLCSSLTT